MKIIDVKKALPVLMRNKIPTFLWGSQGVGKTETVAQFCKDTGLEMVVLHLSTQEPGDLIGLLDKSEAKGGTVRHLRPDWFPTTGRGIIFLDEFNRAPRDVLQTMLPFVLSGTLHTHTLPEGWYVMAAGNYESDRFQTTSIQDAALLSRFCHLDFTPSVEEWLAFVESRGLFEVASFIREQPSMLELSAKDAGRLDESFIVPDRRSWTNGIARLDSEDLQDHIRFELYKGLVGQAAAAGYISSKNRKERPLYLGQILSKYSGAVQQRVLEITSDKKSRQFDLLNQPLDELLAKIELDPNFLTGAGMLDNLKLFLLDVPLELSMKIFSKMGEIKKFEGRDQILNDGAYVARFSSDKTA